MAGGRVQRIQESPIRKCLSDPRRVLKCGTQDGKQSRAENKEGVPGVDGKVQDEQARGDAAGTSMSPPKPEWEWSDGAVVHLQQRIANLHFGGASSDGRVPLYSVSTSSTHGSTATLPVPGAASCAARL